MVYLNYKNIDFIKVLKLIIKKENDNAFKF